MQSSYGIVRRETSTLSSDGHSWLRIMMWLPHSSYTVRGVVQLLHGMSEHIGRYDQFARYLADLGYMVFGHDHIGHGKSVRSSRELGHMPLEQGKSILLEDIQYVQNAVFHDSALYNEAPFFLFGHSMGSYVARVAMTQPSQHPLCGVVLCGTGHQPYLLTRIGNRLTHVWAALKGEIYRSSTVESLVMGSFSSSVSDAEGSYDWLCSDMDAVDEYCADPLCGGHFTVGAYGALTDVVSEAVSKKTAQQVPADLPLLFVSGEEDPVGALGKGVNKAADLYKRCGVQDVRVILYPNMRHEIIHETRKVNVFSDIEGWLTHHVILQSIKQEQMADQLSDIEAAEDKQTPSNQTDGEKADMNLTDAISVD